MEIQIKLHFVPQMKVCHASRWNAFLAGTEGNLRSCVPDVDPRQRVSFVHENDLEKRNKGRPQNTCYVQGRDRQCIRSLRRDANQRVQGQTLPPNPRHKEPKAEIVSAAGGFRPCGQWSHPKDSAQTLGSGTLPVSRTKAGS